MESIGALREWWRDRFPVMDKQLGCEFREHVDAIEREVEDGWVRKSKEHVVSHATVEVTPHIDWSHMADELDVFTQLVRGFAEQVEEDA